MKNLCIKKIVFTVLFTMTSLITIAQEKEQQREVGIAFSDLNNFGLTYKTGTSKSLWRYNILAANLNGGENSYENQSNNFINLGLNASIGKEFRKVIANNLEFRHGIDIGFFYNYSENESNGSKNTTSFISPSVNGVIGVNYLFNTNFAFGVEILPSISYQFGTTKYSNNGQETSDRDINHWSIGFQNNFARLSLSYRF